MLPSQWHHDQGHVPVTSVPVLDIARITRMVGWKILSKGMYPAGLYRAGFLPRLR